MVTIIVTVGNPYVMGWGVYTVDTFYHVRVSAITNIARVPPLHGQQFKHFRLPELSDINWRFVSLWILSVFQNFTIFTKAISPVLVMTMGHVLRLVYSEVKYMYLLLKSKKRVRSQHKCNFLSLLFSLNLLSRCSL